MEGQARGSGIACRCFRPSRARRVFRAPRRSFTARSPPISISIRKLEEWVGQPLFVRGSGARTLTDAGALLLEYADRMLNLREEIRKGMKRTAGARARADFARRE